MEHFASTIFIVVIFVAFYWILLRPVLKDRQRQLQDIANLQVGDRVLTTAGFFGTVAEIHVPDDGPAEVMLELAPGVRVRALTSSITQRLAGESAPAAEAAVQDRAETTGG